MKVGFVSLGCSKNLIDTEVAIGKLKEHNFEIVNKPQEAEMIIINTCGFIDSAKEEAINTILEMAEYKKENCKYLVVMGCLVQRYLYSLTKALPEVDLFIKLEEYDKLWEKINSLIEGKTSQEKITKRHRKIQQMPMFKKDEYLQRTVSTGKNYAYLKIGEGCSNMCTYCAIPYIRGLFISRPMEDILKEAQILAAQGIKELIIIAQDTTKYGTDLYREPKLAELLKKLCEIDGIQWIRFLYAYPEGITEELIDVVKNQDKICKYFDIPIQHISDDILKRMNRKTSKNDIKNLIAKIREQIPNVALRTSLIVGFPGETDQQFEELCDFVKETKFDRLGVFEYSKEEGTPASKMPNQVHSKVKRTRYNEIMSMQQEISRDNLKKKLGKKLKVLLESVSKDNSVFIGRTSFDAPDIDGVVYVKGNEDTKINSIIECEIVGIRNYDLIGNTKISKNTCNY